MIFNHVDWKIRFRDKSNEDTKYIHTLNSTLVAIERTIVSIMENFQTHDGHIRIPQVFTEIFWRKDNLTQQSLYSENKGRK